MNLSLTGSLWLAASGAMLAAAVWRDATVQRIPNWAVLSGAAAALTLSIAPGGVGLGSALSGLAAGLAMLLPFNLLRVMGAGDVKLLAAVGAFVGFPGVLEVSLVALLAGGMMSLAWAIRLHIARKVLMNLRTGLITALASVTSGSLPRAGDFPVSTARIPYAFAIAIGAAVYVLLSDKVG